MESFQTQPWRQTIAATDAAHAVAIALDVAARLRDPDQADAAADVAARQTAFPLAVHWQPSSIAQGYAGLAVMCGYLDACFPDDGWDVTGHAYLTRAARGAEGQPYLSPSLFGGLSGLAFAVWSLSRGGARYRRLLATVEDALVPQALALAEECFGQRNGVAVGQFDLISGLAGVGAYLLCRRADPEPRAALRTILRALIALSDEDDGLPRWHTPPHLMSDEPMLRLYPAGNLNCGLAHGIPGPLALLALARRAGVTEDGQAAAIERLAGWLAEHRVDDLWGASWPTAVALGPAAAAAPPRPSRSAWCYGSPGVARALWLAGAALDRRAYRDLAIAAMAAVYRRPLAERAIDSPTFCHGVAGLLQITLRFAHDTGLAQFADAAATLSRQLLALYDPATRLGYYSLEPGGQRVDQPGLLDGAPGAALVLLAAATTVEPAWDRLFLLA